MKNETTSNLEKEETNENLVPKSTRSFKMEVILSAAIFALGAILAATIGLLMPANLGDPITISYSAGKTIIFEKAMLFTSIINGFFISLLALFAFAFIKPSGIKPVLGNKNRNLLLLSILAVLGVLAYVVLGIIASPFGLPLPLVQGIIALVVITYDLLVYKLYLENRTYSNAIFWEVFRFAIVGLVAAIFDFLAAYLVQFFALGGSTEWYVTIISTTCGFIIGVIMNYLMSTYMVYKASKSNLSKTPKGIVFFVFLSAIGLGIGIGLQYFFYDFLFVVKGVGLFSFPVVFVIRTLIVMVYNYLSRKFFIYK
ncbi:MAG: GtrA family protein [Bacilli bacterium]|nr:GtrA family protein [Bacilli bacterium]